MILLINGMLVETLQIDIPTEQKPHNVLVRCLTNKLLMRYNYKQFANTNDALHMGLLTFDSRGPKDIH
jgi:hypothetical protein